MKVNISTCTSNDTTSDFLNLESILHDSFPVYHLLYAMVLLNKQEISLFKQDKQSKDVVALSPDSLSALKKQYEELLACKLINKYGKPLTEMIHHKLQKPIEIANSPSIELGALCILEKDYTKLFHALNCPKPDYAYWLSLDYLNLIELALLSNDIDPTQHSENQRLLAKQGAAFTLNDVARDYYKFQKTAWEQKYPARCLIDPDNGIQVRPEDFYAEATKKGWLHNLPEEMQRIFKTRKPLSNTNAETPTKAPNKRSECNLEKLVGMLTVLLGKQSVKYRKQKNGKTSINASAIRNDLNKYANEFKLSGLEIEQSNRTINDSITTLCNDTGLTDTMIHNALQRTLSKKHENAL